MISVLCIEDNEDSIFLFRRRLGRRGYKVTFARDGEEGMALARSDPPSVILMDLDLPIVDGWEATRRLKVAPDTGGIPIVAVSSHATMLDRRRALAAGCDDFFTKPVDMAALFARIEALSDPESDVAADGPAGDAK